MTVDNIAIVLYDLSVAGGIQRMSMQMAKILAENGYNVDLITFFLRKDSLNALYRAIEGAPRNLRILKPLNLPKAAPVTLASYLIRLLHRKLKNYELIINAHGDVQPIIANIVYFHQFNVDYNFHAGTMQRRVMLLPLWWIRKEFIEDLRNSDAWILVNSTWTYAEARRFWDFGNVSILYPPVPVEKLKDLARIPRKENCVVTISRLSPDRGIKNVFELAKEFPSVKFIIAGHVQDARYFSYLLTTKPDNVSLYPNITEDFKVRLFKKAKVYLNLTPYVEGFGIAVAEAMAAGLIPITKNTGGVIDFVPKEYRFNDLVEAKRIMMMALKEWSIEKSVSLSNIVVRFSLSNFRRHLLEIVNAAISKRV